MNILKNLNNSITVLISLLILTTISCQDQEVMKELAVLKENTAKLEANKNLVRRAHNEIWSKGDTSLVNELYDKNYIAHWVSGGDTGIEDFKKMIIKSRTAFPDLKEEIIHIVAEDNFVVTHFTSSGTMTGSLNGIPPTGKKGNRPEIAVHKILNGKIVEQWTVADLLSLLNQLGIKL